MKRYITGLIAAGLLMSSCENYLDRESITDYPAGAEEGFYKSEAAIKQGAAGAYQLVGAQIPGTLVPQYVFFDHYTPMGIERTENTSLGAGGGLNQDNGTVLTVWTNCYKAIARCNSVLDGSSPFASTFTAKAKQYVAEVRVLRAFMYGNLVSLYGDVPLFKKAAGNDDLKVSRTPQKEVVDFILSELDLASADLPWKSTEWGRVDRSVAQGLKARYALLAGSLNIGEKGSDYLKIARDAAKSVMDNSGRSLNPSFDALFTRAGQATAASRSENMFEVMFSDQGSKNMHYISYGECSRNYGQSGRFPTQLLVDTYECKDGKRIDESPLYNPKKPFENRDPRLKSTIWAHGDTVIGNGGSRVKFVADIYRANTSFYDYASNTWIKKVNADINSAAAWTSMANSGVGFLWKKYNNWDDEVIHQATYNWVLMRYSEVLLTYAEAKTELGELDGTLYDAINTVRRRAKMPDVATEVIGNADKTRQLVRRERKVELAREGLHLFDMRRWRTGDIENDSPTYGYPDVTRNNGAIVYDASGNPVGGGYDNATADMVPSFKKSARHDLNDIADYSAYASKLRVRDRSRFWDNKFYLWPIPQSERNLNPNLTQNGY